MFEEYKNIQYMYLYKEYRGVREVWKMYMEYGII